MEESSFFYCLFFHYLLLGITFMKCSISMFTVLNNVGCIMRPSYMSMVESFAFRVVPSGQSSKEIFPVPIWQPWSTGKYYQTQQTQQGITPRDYCAYFLGCTVLHVNSYSLMIINSIWSSGTIWRHRSQSSLAQVMACCLTAPSHYLNHCWLLITVRFTWVQFHSDCPSNNFV